MKKSILCTLLLLGSLLLSGCAAEPAETMPPTETLPSVPERPVLRDVKFVSGTTFSGALRPLVFPEKTAEYEVLAMPVLLIETEEGAPIDSKEVYQNAALSLYGCEEKYILEDVPMEIRGRGNNSWTYPKKSYKFKLTEKQNILGLADGKERTWCLLANQCDLSLQRNRISFEFCRYMDGIDWSPACTPVEVYLNGEYVGAYLLVEEIKVSGDRVHITDTAPDEIDTGYLVEMSNYAEGDTLFHVNGRAYMIHSDLSENLGTWKKQRSFIRDYITEAQNALLTGTREEAAKWLDLDSLA
ncbi:MAG: CotH kinase family protein, partial [Clostridia bacterium]|nr:CotH kinase family protein [Clostridia bacterium]